MSEHNAETAQVLSVPSEDAMFEFLTGLNVSGLHPEVACSMGEGGAFLATLTDPDADHVYIIRSASDGREHCCECAHEGGKCHEFRTDPWPRYPVLALVTEWPEVERCAADEIDTWWLSTRPGTLGGDT